MKKTLIGSSLLIMALSSLSLLAQAQYRERGPGYDHGFRDHNRRGYGESRLCQGLIQGIWNWKGGRHLSITISARGYNQIEVITSQRNGSTSSPGTCQYDSRTGGAFVTFNGQSNGSLSIGINGRVSGVVQGLAYNGQMAGVQAPPIYPPQPPPPPIYPHPPIYPEPQPPRFENLCQGFYSGIWNWKGGRDVTVTLVQTGRDQVNVTVSQRNGTWTVVGSCRQDRNGALVTFSENGGGSLHINYGGSISGVLAGLSYSGSRR
ncbi:MAG: hypothetical protein ACK5P7_11165 [Bdellovibrio sp.]|jgi:hypothetical protein